MKTINDWQEYQILMTAEGMKLENWNGFKLFRPDPQIIWHSGNNSYEYDAKYSRRNTGGGSREIVNPKMADKWQIHY